MRIVFFGDADMGSICLRALIAAGKNVIKVYAHTQAREPTGYRYASVYDGATELGIPAALLAPKDTNLVADELRRLQADLLISVNWRGLFRKEILSIPSLRCINLHGSRLPKYRGNAPVTWAIINGERETGATVHYINEGIDDGNILAQSLVEIGPDESVAEVLAKLKATNGELLLSAVRLLESGKTEGIPQDSAHASIGKKRKPEDGLIDWGKSAKQIHDWIRAQSYPLPGAFTILRSTLKVHVWRSRYWVEKHQYAPGTVAALTTEEIVVAAADGFVAVKELSLEGTAGETAAEFVDRVNLSVGDKLT